MAAALTKGEVEAYLSSVDLRSPLEEALNVAVSNLTKDPPKFLAGHFGAAKVSKDIGINPAMVGPCDGLLPQPIEGVRYTLLLVEYNIPGHSSGVGGADKGKNGHRVDSIPIANGVIKTNNYCFPIKCDGRSAHTPERVTCPLAVPAATSVATAAAAAAASAEASRRSPLSHVRVLSHRTVAGICPSKRPSLLTSSRASTASSSASTRASCRGRSSSSMTP